MVMTDRWPDKQKKKKKIMIDIIWLYRVSQKKRNGGFSVHCELKVINIFISLDRSSSAEENGT